MLSFGKLLDVGLDPLGTHQESPAHSEGNIIEYLCLGLDNEVVSPEKKVLLMPEVGKMEPFVSLT